MNINVLLYGWGSLSGGSSWMDFEKSKSSRDAQSASLNQHESKGAFNNESSNSADYDEGEYSGSNGPQA